MNRKSDQQLITPNSNTAKPFMHQGREKKNYDPEALMVNHDKNSFSSLLGYGITFNCVSIPTIIIRDNPCWTGCFTLICQDITTNADKTEIIEIECQH